MTDSCLWDAASSEDAVSWKQQWLSLRRGKWGRSQWDRFLPFQTQAASQSVRPAAVSLAPQQQGGHMLTQKKPDTALFCSPRIQNRTWSEWTWASLNERKCTPFQYFLSETQWSEDYRPFRRSPPFLFNRRQTQSRNPSVDNSKMVDGAGLWVVGRVLLMAGLGQCQGNLTLHYCSEACLVMPSASFHWHTLGGVSGSRQQPQ